MAMASRLTARAHTWRVTQHCCQLRDSCWCVVLESSICGAVVSLLLLLLLLRIPSCRLPRSCSSWCQSMTWCSS